MNDTLTTILGLVRDFVAAILGVLILFGVNWTQEQIAGVLLVVSTGAALLAYVVQSRNRRI